MSDLVVMPDALPSLPLGREAQIVAEIHSLLASAEHAERDIKAALLAQVTRFVRVAKLVEEVRPTLEHGEVGPWMQQHFRRHAKTVQRWAPVVRALQQKHPEALEQIPPPDGDQEQLSLFGKMVFNLAGFDDPQDFKFAALQKWGTAALRPPKRVRVRGPKAPPSPEKQLQMQQMLAAQEWGEIDQLMAAHGANFVFLSEGQVRAQMARLAHELKAREHWLSFKAEHRDDLHINRTAALLASPPNPPTAHV